jgi:hypothetical protein
MKRIWIQRPRVRRERPWLEVLPLGARDQDVVRAKALAVAQRDHLSGSQGRGGGH